MPLDTTILEASVEFIDRPLRQPLRLSSGIITEATEARATVTVSVGGRTASGRGCIYLSDLWAWPDALLSHEERDTALRALCEEFASNLYWLCGAEPVHPMELGLRLNSAVCDRPGLPALACAMCASPFDAALHDAAGRAVGRSAFRLYDVACAIPSLAGLLGDGNPWDAVREVIQKPRIHLDAWWIVGSVDSVEHDVAPAVRRSGYRCFKLKLLGKDAAVDAERTVEVYRGLRGIGVDRPTLTGDSNGANPNADSVADYLEVLRTLDSEAYDALDYLEQPAGRDIKAEPHDWRDVAEHKPVFVDEGLTSLSVLSTARDQGWSGLGLKTCKGHSLILAAAAWAKQQGMEVSVQDLTNPGFAAIHNALFASHVSTRNGVEINSLQYTPAANEECRERLPGIFEPQDGQHHIEEPGAIGLGTGS